MPPSLTTYLQQVNRAESVELCALRARTSQLPFVAHLQGASAVTQLLQLLVHLTAARRVLEIGTFTGCTTLGIAEALPPDGHVVTIDVTEQWAALGFEHWHRSGLAGRISLHIGDAKKVLAQMAQSRRMEPFELVFVDADKDAYEHYLNACLPLMRPGGLLVFDNVLFGGRVLPEYSEADVLSELSKWPPSLQRLYVNYVRGLRKFNEQIVRDPRVDVVVLPLHDGLTLARKREFPGSETSC